MGSSFGNLNPTAGTAGSTGAGQNPNNTIVLTIAVDAKTGQAQITQITSALKNLGNAAQQAGNQAANAGNSANSSANGWLKLYAQTELVARGFEMLNNLFHATIESSTMVAARTEVLNTVLAVTARNMNYTTAQAEAQVKGIQSMNIAHQNAIEATLALMRAQVNLAQATGLARAAQDLAVVAGENSSATLEHITMAIQEQNPWMLRQYGIVTNLNTVLETYAARLNKTADQLTQTERSQALLNTVMTEAGKVAGSYVLSMEDVGKMMTSTERLMMDTKEAIGNAFLPALTVLVSNFNKFLEVIKDLNPLWLQLAGMLAITIGTVVTLSGVVFGLAKAWDAVKVAALGAAEAEATAGLGIAAVAGALSAWLIPITAIAVALGGIVGYMSIFGAKAQQTEKNLKAQAEAVNAQKQGLDDLVKAYGELSDDQQKLTDIENRKADVTQKELHMSQLLSAEDNRRMAITARENDIKTRRNVLDQQALAIARDATKVELDQATGKEKLVVDQQKLIELQKQAATDRDNQIKKQQADIDAINQKQIENVKARASLQQNEAEYKKLSVSQQAWLSGMGEGVDYLTNLHRQMEGYNKQWEDNNKQLTQANATMRDLKNTANGLQVTPIDFMGMVNGLNSARALQIQMIQAQREGVKVGAAQLQMVHDQATGLLNIDNISKDVDAAWSKMQNNLKGQDAALAEQKKHYDVIKAAVDGMKKDRDDI
jgi:hypothetical protein